ncbi:60S ribosomal protein L30 [Apostasia shenzhenica]|uniref:60S ribosomal protein L30 n=1 Tax=Apostasia shenzhenica TaxID=1088818 RepID=A0A2I0BD45_9ASPA|nr:60S ribosomal protein L30 [Apostasia shenzhenica]
MGNALESRRVAPVFQNRKPKSGVNVPARLDRPSVSAKRDDAAPVRDDVVLVRVDAAPVSPRRAELPLADLASPSRVQVTSFHDLRQRCSALSQTGSFHRSPLLLRPVVPTSNRSRGFLGTLATSSRLWRRFRPGTQRGCRFPWFFYLRANLRRWRRFGPGTQRGCRFPWFFLFSFALDLSSGNAEVLQVSQASGKLVIIANNCPPLRKSEIEYYAMLAKVGVHHFNGNNVDLGTACGKYFRVCCLSIIDPGDSDIIKTIPGDH